MPNGKPGDNPLSDLLLHGAHPFPKDIEEMLLRIHELGRSEGQWPLGEDWPFSPREFDWEKGKDLDEARRLLSQMIERLEAGQVDEILLSDEGSAEYYAHTYDESVPDWPGEIDFYRDLALEAKRNGESALEIACGTGRVAIRLAQEGVAMVGLDLSLQMLDVARGKSAGLKNMRWVQGNMCSFELGENFGLVIIPGHAFQHLNTPQDQLACLACIRRHLLPGGRLLVHLDHQDLRWLGDLLREKGGVFEAEKEFQHPVSGRRVRASRAWRYEPASQTAVLQTAWEELDEAGQVLNRRLSSPLRLHCIFRFEMEHLLGRAGFTIEAVYGDFFRNPLGDKSLGMIWVARKG